jgi:hypothetical protein
MLPQSPAITDFQIQRLFTRCLQKKAGRSLFAGPLQ